jgi:hypothetical protein
MMPTTPRELAKLAILRIIERGEVKKHSPAQCHLLGLVQDGYLTESHKLTQKAYNFLRLHRDTSLGSFDPTEFEGT